MSVKLKIKDDKTIIETDSGGSANLHHLIRDHSREVIGAMRSYGIKEIEVRDSDTVLYDLEEKFNEEWKKRGFKEKYFHRA